MRLHAVYERSLADSSSLPPAAFALSFAVALSLEKVEKLERGKRRARTFTAWSHVVALLYAQRTDAFVLNDVCHGVRHHAGLARECPGFDYACSQNASPGGCMIAKITQYLKEKPHPCGQDFSLTTGQLNSTSPSNSPCRAWLRATRA